MKGAPELTIADSVTLTFAPPDQSDAAAPSPDHGQVVLEWESSPAADCTADAVVAVLLQAQGPPPAIGAAEMARKCASNHWHLHASLLLLATLLSTDTCLQQLPSACPMWCALPAR